MMDTPTGGGSWQDPVYVIQVILGLVLVAGAMVWLFIEYLAPVLGPVLLWRLAHGGH